MKVLADQKARDLIANELDKTLVVEAAAGTGKTTELVNRIISVLASGRTTVDRIVAVTFTDKAAGELKLRLRIGLEKARSRDGLSNQERRNLEEAVAHLEEARAGTIHSFCADLLRERPMEACIDPQFEALDESTAEQLYRSAFRTWLENVLEDPPEGVRRSLRRPSEDGPTERLLKAGWTLASWRDFVAEWQRPNFDRKSQIDTLVKLLHELAELTSRASDPTHPVYTQTRRARDLSAYIQTVEKSRKRDYDGLESQLIALAKARDFRIKLKWPPKYGDGLSRNQVIAAHEALVTALQQFAILADADLASLLRNELRQSIAIYESLKSCTGKLDFLDLLLRARDLVRNDSVVRAGLQQRFTHIFVDEFQDTDPLQVEVLLLLASDDPTISEWRQVRVKPGKLFLVGDPKQAIYRFRRADVGVYLEAKELLVKDGAIPVYLTTSFRSVPFIQNAVNAAFAPLMHGDRQTLQADYVPLTPYREQLATQPSVIALSVPEPYAKVKLAASAVEESLPDATGAFVDWVLRESGWKISEHGQEERVPVQPHHVCIMFRRFDSMFGGDMTRGYAEALQARGIPHVLVGGKSFHEREEVETMRTALAAIEWPDDTLSLYATLRGPLFALSDADLLSYKAQLGRWHMFRIPNDVSDDLKPVRCALDILRELSRRRNYRPIAETVNQLLTATRAHTGFAMRPAGEQALANVLHIAELARQYESKGAVSFRGFVEELLEAAERGKQSEAMIYEEGSEGVRMMTVHRAKGLEFPIVILADPTCKLAREQPDRYLDLEHNLSAVKLAGWTPLEVIEHAAEEHARDLAEAMRLAYVAATRARDVLVVPAIGEDITGSGPELAANWWISPLHSALYPAEADRHRATSPKMCPKFGIDTVLRRPDGSPPYSHTVKPGAHSLRSGAEAYTVVWWDPSTLELGKAPSFSIRQQELLQEPDDYSVIQNSLQNYATWKTGREELIAKGSVPTIQFQTATQRSTSEIELDIEVELIEITKEPRPFGPRFGGLVHGTLATIDLSADRNQVEKASQLQGRILGATREEISAAADAVFSALEHPLLKRAHAAAMEGCCYRELPLTLKLTDGLLVEGVADLVFSEHGKWSVVDFKTDHELSALSRYRRQIAIYAAAVRERTQAECTATLLRV
jgi:ATP-dependent exoDNAse (exonuclease V) beta subunit